LTSLIETVGKLHEKSENFAVKLQFSNPEEAVAKFKSSFPAMTVEIEDDEVIVQKPSVDLKKRDELKPSMEKLKAYYQYF
jgi:hypothetical protein